MSSYTRQHPGHPSNQDECPPDHDPADQPNAPGGECDKIPDVDIPKLKEPEKCPPAADCNCPPVPPASSTCFDDLLAEQSKEIAKAELAKKFKDDLDALIKGANAGALDYTKDKYDKLVKEWMKQDDQIADLIRKIVCAVPCWRCVIECHICPLLEEVRYREQKLYGDGTLYSEVRTLHDLRYWHERNQDAKQRAFTRIKAVLAVWEKPAQAIEKALQDNAKLIAEAGKVLAPDAAKLVYDVFLRLVPVHLAIAPPKEPGMTTAIAKEYTDFCECDKGDPDACCGPDVGKPTVRRRVIAYQPYLVKPDDYYAIICCLVKERYLPAKNALAEAQSGFQHVDAEVRKYMTEIDEKIKSLEKDAKAAIPSAIDCCDYERDDDDSTTTRRSAR